MSLPNRFSAYFLISFFLVSLALTSCEEDCRSNNSNLMDVAFYDSLHVLQKINVDTIIAFGVDTAFYRFSAENAEYQLPLSYEVDTASFVFKTFLAADSAVTFSDTLKVKYLITPNLKGTECGFDIKLHRLEVVSHTFDSVTVVNGHISTDPYVNVEIYY